MDMVERVATAIGLRSIERGHPVKSVVVRHLAVAAIEAMREPTDAMLAAADDAWVGADRAPPEIEYRMMIGSVLKKA